MIFCKEDLKYYLREDARALGNSGRKRPKWFGDDIWKFQIVLRKREYFTNIKPTLKSKILKKIYHYRHKKIELKLGYEVPINVCGPGLRINHYGLLIIHQNAKIGANCDINQGVIIGQNGHYDDVPEIGDNVWIAPGVKIFGKIIIANGTAIGANSVVNKSVLEENTTVAGAPAKKIKNTGTNEMVTAANLV